jgi:hypothetical protein
MGCISRCGLEIFGTKTKCKGAIAAGMWAIGLAPKEQSDRFNGTAHIVLPNLKGFDLSDIQAKLGK